MKFNFDVKMKNQRNIIEILYNLKFSFVMLKNGLYLVLPVEIFQALDIFKKT